MDSELVRLIVGFLLTSVLGGLLAYLFQRRTWSHQHKVQQYDQDRQQAVKTFEEISRLLDRRRYRMKRLYWAARRKALGTGSMEDLSSARADYSEVLFEWNDSLNRTLALVQTYFGNASRAQLESEIYEGFVTLNRAIEEIVRLVSKDDGVTGDLPKLGYAVDRLSRRVYQFNVHILNLLESERIGRRASQSSLRSSGVQNDERLTAAPMLQMGDTGKNVRRLQRALRRGGEELVVDGIFGPKTWAAVQSIQRAHGLDVDGISGPAVWATLPSGEPMPLLRHGSQGEVVAALQRVLTEEAPDRWNSVPEAITGNFDSSTSAAVRAFQQWHGIESDGMVGDRTWSSTVGDEGATLEDAVGTGHVGVGD